jgi:hypothetical protein
MWQTLSVKETVFYERLNHILRGFKEIRINRRKNEDVFSAYESVNNAMRDALKPTESRRDRLARTHIAFPVLTAPEPSGFGAAPEDAATAKAISDWIYRTPG